MHINLNIEVIKIFKLELVITTDNKPAKTREVVKDEKGSNPTTTESK
jgi:hypothetical protein